MRSCFIWSCSSCRRAPPRSAGCVPPRPCGGRPAACRSPPRFPSSSPASSSGRATDLSALAAPTVAICFWETWAPARPSWPATPLAAAADSEGQAMLLRAHGGARPPAHGRGLGERWKAPGARRPAGSTAAGERAAIVEGFASGQVDVLIGTHAALRRRRAAQPHPGGHRRAAAFGVDQRAKLLARGRAPDALYLTATPIRTLALALYGNLTLSYIKHRPPRQRAAHDAGALPRAAGRRLRGGPRGARDRGEQVFVVCPLVGKDADARMPGGGAREADAAGREYHPAVAIEDDADSPATT